MLLPVSLMEASSRYFLPHSAPPTINHLEVLPLDFFSILIHILSFTVDQERKRCKLWFVFIRIGKWFPCLYGWEWTPCFGCVHSPGVSRSNDLSTIWISFTVDRSYRGVTVTIRKTGPQVNLHSILWSLVEREDPDSFTVERSWWSSLSYYNRGPQLRAYFFLTGALNSVKTIV
jgi:hypothetical protein